MSLTASGAAWCSVKDTDSVHCGGPTTLGYTHGSPAFTGVLMVNPPPPRTGSE